MLTSIIYVREHTYGRMSSEEYEVYIMQDTDDEWVHPTPARIAIRDEVTKATDLERDDLDELDVYVDMEALDAVLTGDEESIEFTVEEYTVTVDESGEIDVEV